MSEVKFVSRYKHRLERIPSRYPMLLSVIDLEMNLAKKNCKMPYGINKE